MNELIEVLAPLLLIAGRLRAALFLSLTDTHTRARSHNFAGSFLSPLPDSKTDQDHDDDGRRTNDFTHYLAAGNGVEKHLRSLLLLAALCDVSALCCAACKSVTVWRGKNASYDYLVFSFFFFFFFLFLHAAVHEGVANTGRLCVCVVAARACMCACVHGHVYSDTLASFAHPVLGWLYGAKHSAGRV